MQLGAFVLAGDYDASWFVMNTYSGHVFLYVLSASACRFEDINFNVRLRDFDLKVVDFRQNGNGDGRSMNTPLRFSFRHALNAVDAGFELETGIGTLALDAQSDFFVTTDSGFVR